MGQANLFWPKFGPGWKNMAQTQLIGMSLGYILVWPSPARPGLGLIEGHFWGWPAMARADPFWPKFGPGQKKTAQTHPYFEGIPTN